MTWGDDCLFSKLFAKKEENYIDQEHVENIDINLDKNISKVKNIYCFPKNSCFSIHELYIKALQKKGALLYLDSIVDQNRVEQFVILPLINNSNNEVEKNDLSAIASGLIPASMNKTISDFSELTRAVNEGKVVLLIEGFDKAVSISASKFEHRSVAETTNENSIKGGKEAFVESAKVNLSLIRKYIKNEKLISERLTVGDTSPYETYILYIDGVANIDVVDRIRKRISQIKTKGILSAGQLEQHIEERPYSLVPTILYTERPDRAS